MKPIFIMNISIFLNALYSSEIEKRMNEFKKQIENDYDVLIIRASPETFFKMFSDKEIEPINLEELKALLNIKKES